MKEHPRKLTVSVNTKAHIAHAWHRSVWERLIVRQWKTQYPSLVMDVRLIADKSVFSSSFSLCLTDLWQRLMEGREKQRAASVQPARRTTSQWVERKEGTAGSNNRSVRAGSYGRGAAICSGSLKALFVLLLNVESLHFMDMSDMMQLSCLCLKGQREWIAIALQWTNSIYIDIIYVMHTVLGRENCVGLDE